MINKKCLIKIARRYLPRSVLFLEWILRKKTAILIDYPPLCKPRYGGGLDTHEKLEEIISRRNADYALLVDQFVSSYRSSFKSLKHIAPTSRTDPQVENDFIPEFDSFVLYATLAKSAPNRYVEVGSGHSTKFARRAIVDFDLDTKITSIDPYPRSEIDLICDVVIREKVEDIDLSYFEQLEKGDILFVDNSHRVFQNSDATVCFIDILPLLKPGVLVQFHDITLPWDYPIEYGANRYYSEQYLLAAYILAMGSRFRIVLPNYYVTKSQKFSELLKSTGQKNPFGSSFWIEMC